MIKNERQYRIAKAEADRFRRTLAALPARPRRGGSVGARLARAEREALASQLDDLKREMAEYEALKSGRVRIIRVGSLDDLPNGLIRARIAAGLSHKALAERVGLREQQIQRYEADDYASASLARLSEIAHSLGLRMREKIEPRRRSIAAVTGVRRRRATGTGA